MAARASRTHFRIQHVAAAPRGWRVRTRREGAHELRIAFPPGPRRKGAGKLVEILHPKRENPSCEMQKNPLGIEELVIFGNPAGRRSRKGNPRGHKPGCPCPICRRAKNSPRSEAQRSARDRAGRIRAARLSNRRNPESPLDHAVDLYQTFHGKDPGEILQKQRSDKIREAYTALGDLDYLVVKSAKDGRLEKLGFDGDGVKLASAPNGAQLYAIGGNQNLSACLKQFTADTSKDIYDLGEVIEAQYFARKAVGNFQPIHYYHKFGEEGGKRPRLGYDALKREIFFAGGEYRIEAPGIIN